jgi:hypothetical protein
LPHQLALINDEIVEVRGSLNKLYAEPETPTITKERKSLLDLLKYLQNQIVQVKAAAKSADLKGQVGEEKGNKEDKGFKSIPFVDSDAGAETMAAVARNNALHAELEKRHAAYVEMQEADAAVLRKSGEDLDAWAARSNKSWDMALVGSKLFPGEMMKLSTAVAADMPVLSALDGSLDDIGKTIKRGTAELKPYVQVMESLGSPQQAANEQIKDFEKATHDLHLHDTSEQLATLARDMDALRAGPGTKTGGTTPADMAEGWNAYGAALAKAAVESRDFSKNLAGAAFQEIPRMFSTIESSLANDLVHWKGWATAIKSIFSQLATDALQIFLHALLAPLENMLTSALSGILSGLFKGGGAGGGGGDGGLGSDLIEGALSIVPFFAEGTDWVPRTGLAMLHEGEAVVPRSENVSNRYSTANYEHNASVGTHFDFRGSSFTGVTQDLVSNVMDKAVKMSRRSGAKW